MSLRSVPNPMVSIVIPAYCSDATIAASLQTMIAQTYRPLEIIVVDSSPDDRCEEIVRTSFPQIAYRHHPRRLYPHAARNVGMQLAKGELILSTDPDIYAPIDWVETLVQAYRSLWGVMVGSVRNYGTNRLDQAIHLCKFDMWLPGGNIRTVDIAPTANVLYPRAFLDAIGGFDPTNMIADTQASWDLTSLGLPLYFVPEAVVEHHHTSTLGELLAERFQRGQEFARLRMSYFGWTRAQIMRTLLLTLVPVRLAKLFLRTAAHALQAHMTMELLRAIPIVLLGHGAWLAGEARGYMHALRNPVS